MLVFLDVDGVLATNSSVTKSCSFGRYKLDVRCVTAFNRFLEKHNPTVVISSAWRMYGLDKLQEIFLINTLDVIIHSFTPEIHPPEEVGLTEWRADRGLEIKQWFDRFPENKEEKFIIIDDDVEDIKNHFNFDHILHLEHGWFNGGFKDKHIAMIEKKIEAQ